MLKFYNTMGHEVQPFKPMKGGRVNMYTCGPTVWNYAHIGNLRTFVFEDVLRRYLEFKGYEVDQVMNITDVEDRIIKAVKATGKSRAEITEFYEKAFREDLATLRVEDAESYPRATDYIGEMVDLIEKLVQNGSAYVAEDGSVYFDVSKFKAYGALSGIKLDSLKSTDRVSSDYYEEKKEARDFALWKAWTQDDGDVFWETSLGKGRPGWHIECSAMSMKLLGESFDIHTGGVDHRFPHHENEIAQSESATGKKFVNYWMHAEFLNFKGRDMHKSIGNVVYLRDLTSSGWDPLTIRTFLISAHYRDPLDLTDEALAQAKAQRTRLQDFADRLADSAVGKPGKFELADALLEKFEEAMDSDLNVPQALAALFVAVKSGNSKLDAGSMTRSQAASLMAAIRRVNSVLGVLDLEEKALPRELADLVARRDDARRRKDFAESDRLRKELLAHGVEVEDTPTGSRWKRRPSG